jgi:hypothetical protein
MKRSFVWAMAVGVLVAAGARDAQAQMSMGSFHGYLTGHFNGVLGADVSNASPGGGLSVSMQETTGWGAEMDFGRSTNVEVDALALDISTYMLNMSFVTPYKRVRPFAIAGGGLTQVEGCLACSRPSTTYDLGLTGGAGVFLLANDVVGVRADARYFWSAGDHPDLGRPEHLSHWRISIGVTYLWTVAP